MCGLGLCVGKLVEVSIKCTGIQQEVGKGKARNHNRTLYVVYRKPVTMRRMHCPYKGSLEWHLPSSSLC